MNKGSGLNEDRVGSAETLARPGAGAGTVVYYPIVPNSLDVIKVKAKHDSKGCLPPEPETKTLVLQIRTTETDIETINIQWPTDGISHIRVHHKQYRVKMSKATNRSSLRYDLEPIPGSDIGQAIASQQKLDPFRRRGVNSVRDPSIDVFGSIGERIGRLKRKVEAARQKELLDDAMKETKLTKVGDPGSNLKIQGYDLHGEDDGDPLAIDNPIDKGLVRMEMAIGDTFKMLGDNKGFKNASKIIKNLIDPHSMQWADWLVNPMTKFLPSTAVIPLKTWVRALAPSAMMMGMIALLKHSVKDIQSKLPPPQKRRVATLNQGGSRTSLTGSSGTNAQPQTGGLLGAVEQVENQIRR